MIPLPPAYAPSSSIGCSPFTRVSPHLRFHSAMITTVNSFRVNAPRRDNEARSRFRKIIDDIDVGEGKGGLTLGSGVDISRDLDNNPAK